MATRRDTGRNAVVVRPPRPDGMRHTPVSIEAVGAREDSNEHIAVSRTVTPTDSQIRRALAKIDDPEARAELERVAKSARDHRLAYEQAIEQKHSDLEDALARLREHDAREARWRLPMQILKGVGIGGLVTGMAFVAQALVSHGDARAASRRQAETVEKLVVTVEELAKAQASDRAQAAADHALLVYLSSRLGAPSNMAPITAPSMAPMAPQGIP